MVTSSSNNFFALVIPSSFAVRSKAWLRIYWSTPLARCHSSLFWCNNQTSCGLAFESFRVEYTVHKIKPLVPDMLFWKISCTKWASILVVPSLFWHNCQNSTTRRFGIRVWRRLACRYSRRSYIEGICSVGGFVRGNEDGEDCWKTGDRTKFGSKGILSFTTRVLVVESEIGGPTGSMSSQPHTLSSRV